MPGGWSIAVEMQFYLLFPLLIWLFRAAQRGANLCYALIALVSVVANDLPLNDTLFRGILPAGQAYLAPRSTSTGGCPTSWSALGSASCCSIGSSGKVCRRSACCCWSALSQFLGMGIDSASPFSPTGSQ